MKGGVLMATSSITKTFIIKDDKTCEKLIKAMNEPRTTKVIKTNSYEEGKEKLKSYFGH